ncbi:MAG: aminoacetone oxidase family FAD-binding enzyme [Spartobacteria bacterium]|nr:aminoacetone oxidase family FAD-binding enzyme [Spartobacteria bacterium]
MEQKPCDIVIVGAGAAGLMAAVQCAEWGLKPLLIERKHQPARKLLMCGNGRCNLTSQLSAEQMLHDIGDPVQSFVRPALEAFPPRAIMGWFEKNGLPLIVHKDQRVFPASEKGTHVLHCFNDLLKKYEMQLITNCSVDSLQQQGDVWLVDCGGFSVQAKHVLLATGGVSYPKTGSVGDGQKIAAQLGHKVSPFRAGLVGFAAPESWMTQADDISFSGTICSICGKDGRVLAETEGEVRLMKWGMIGPAVINASRLIARNKWDGVSFSIDLMPRDGENDVVSRWNDRLAKEQGLTWETLLQREGIPREIAASFCSAVLQLRPNQQVASASGDVLKKAAHGMKNWHIVPGASRSLKEAMVTIGGIALSEINPETMASKKNGGLYFAGEVMDVDGPTGGYNLSIAFATASLAVSAMARSMGIQKKPVEKCEGKQFNQNFKGHTGGGRQRYSSGSPDKPRVKGRSSRNRRR